MKLLKVKKKVFKVIIFSPVHFGTVIQQMGAYIWGRGGGGGLKPDVFFCLQVNGPKTRKGGGGVGLMTGSLWWHCWTKSGYYKKEFIAIGFCNPFYYECPLPSRHKTLLTGISEHKSEKIILKKYLELGALKILLTIRSVLTWMTTAPLVSLQIKKKINLNTPQDNNCT